MKLSEAMRLDREGKLRRRVFTEDGWYAPMERVPETGPERHVLEKPSRAVLHTTRKA